jgi:hypothetical protein
LHRCIFFFEHGQSVCPVKAELIRLGLLIFFSEI